MMTWQALSARPYVQATLAAGRRRLIVSNIVLNACDYAFSS